MPPFCQVWFTLVTLVAVAAALDADDSPLDPLFSFQTFAGDPPSGVEGGLANAPANILPSTVLSVWSEIPSLTIPDSTPADSLKLWANSTMVVYQNSDETGGPLYQRVGNGMWTEIVRGTVRQPVTSFHIRGDQLFYGFKSEAKVMVREGDDWPAAEPVLYHTLPDNVWLDVMCSRGDFIMISAIGKGGLFPPTPPPAAMRFSRDNGKNWFGISEERNMLGRQCSIDATGKVINVLSQTQMDIEELEIAGFDVTELLQFAPIPSVVRSVDGGLTWDSAYFYVSPDTAGTLLTLTNAAFVGDKKGIYRTEKNWFSTFRVGADNGGLPESLTSNWTQLAGSDDVVFAGSPVEGAGMITSEDNGKTWKQADPPSEAAEISEYVVDAMHFDTSAKTLYAFWKIGTSWKLFSSVFNN